MANFWIKIHLASNIMDLNVGEDRVINNCCELCIIVQNVPFLPVTSRLKEPPFCSGAWL